MTSPSKGQNLSAVVARRSNLSRRKAGEAIKAGRVTLNGQVAELGLRYTKGDIVQLDGQDLIAPELVYVVLNKPVGYECSRTPQGNNPSVYELIPQKFQNLHHVGRLDTDSSGLLLFTNDGQLTNQLTHPSFEKEKIYEVQLDKALSGSDIHNINNGILLDDGVSNMTITGGDRTWTVRMSEGRNRQIRRTFRQLGYRVIQLHRTHFGEYELSDLKTGKIKVVK